MIQRKKIYTCVLAAVCSCLMSFPASAASNTVVTYSGNADQLDISGEAAMTDTFAGMEPGETKEVQVELRNTSDKEKTFFFSGEIIDNFAENGSEGTDGNQEAIYLIDIYKDGEEIFNGLVGSKYNTEAQAQQVADNLGLDFLKEDTLLAAIPAGESANMTIRIKLDGDSIGNAYQNTSGSFEFRFSTGDPASNARDPEYRKSTVITSVTRDIMQKVKTGDTTTITYLIIAATAALAIVIGMIILLIKKRKKTGEE